MGMTFNANGIGGYLEEQIERRVKALIFRLNYIGVACVNKARNDGTYEDQTGNLRSSIGYVIVRDGVIVDASDFYAGKDGATTFGAASGEAYIKRLAAGYPHGIVLIIVAGMNYASYVEALNYDVLTSAELLAEQLVPKLLKQLGFK
ncbi:MAG: hypothetical protein M1445_06120 [Bacteroidetes bacterium]|nr:hypothetical protein [Bacteroidota bacterium]